MILKPTTQQYINRDIYGFDIETYDDNKKFLMASIVGDNYEKVFFDKRSLIKEFKKDRFRNSYVVATNLLFDFFGTFHKQPEQEFFKTLFRGSDLVFAEAYIEYQEFVHKPKNSRRQKITFIDTFNYAKMSVDTLGKIINIPKLKTPEFIGQYPKDKEQWEEMIKYNIRDSTVSMEFMKFLYASFEDLGATPKKTIASTSMSLFKNKFLKNKYFTANKDALLDQFKGYYGGRTEAFCRGEIKDYHYYDFNSLYPSVMLNEFPDPNSMSISYNNSLKWIKEREGMSFVKVECPYMDYPLLPYRTKEKILFPTGTFSGWYCHNELRKALEVGYKILKVNKTYHYSRTCEPFKVYVQELYNLRLKYKKNPMEKVVKLCLNSLYGKFGQKFENRDNWIHENLVTIKDLESSDTFERIEDYIRITKTDKPSGFCIPIWASYVTAYGRIKLWDAIIDAEPVYVDTDSIVTKKEMPTSDKLGDLKLEMDIKEGIVVKPKFYAFVDSNDNEYVKIKGIGKRLNMLEFYGIMAKPEVGYNKFTKFKEAMRRDLTPNVIQKVKKHLSLEDTKREWENAFNPFSMQLSKPREIIHDMIYEIKEGKEILIENKLLKDIKLYI